MQKDHRLPEEGAHLGAADVEGVGEPGDVLQGHVRRRGHQAVAQPRPVQEQVEAVPVADLPQPLQLRAAVQEPALGGVGDVDHPGLHRVLMAVVRPMGLHVLVHGGGADLALLIRQGQDLVARGLDGAGLVDVDMAGAGGQDPLIGPEGRGDDGLVGLGPAHQELDAGVRPADGGADQGPGVVTVGVLPVAGVLLEVGGVEGRHDLGAGALVVIAGKTDHITTPYKYLPDRRRTPSAAGASHGPRRAMFRPGPSASP